MSSLPVPESLSEQQTPANVTQTEQARVRRSFSEAAATYDAAAVLQREIADRMLERLEYIKLQPKRVLDAGCGTGYALRPLAARYPDAQLVALDLAEAMVRTAVAPGDWREKLKGLLGRGARPGVVADCARLPFADASFDLLWSNVTIQWVNDLPAMFADWHRALRVDGLVMFTTFGPDTLKELRAAFIAADGVNTHVNRFVDLHDIGDMLVHAGFADPVMDMEVITLTYDKLDALFRDLKAIGAHNATVGRQRGLTGKARWRKMVEAYERFRSNGKLPATYEVIYGHAWKPQSRHAPDGRSVIRMDLPYRRGVRP